MKRVWLVVALVALAGGLATKTYADVQDIRLSGDIRVRGYWLKDVGGTGFNNQIDGADSYISQRTRVSVSADLEDNVSVVVTLKAEGLWGENNATNNGQVPGAGAGSIFGNSGNLNRGFDVGIDEAYVRLQEAFYTPMTAMIGRQYLHYGRGLIISGLEQEYNFDAARLVLDYHPLVIDLVYATMLENSVFGGQSNPFGDNDMHLLFANAKFAPADSIIKGVEGYFGYLINSQPPTPFSNRVLPGFGGASPFLIGARAEVEPLNGLSTWVEGAFEWGPDGYVNNDTIEAYIINAGGTFALKDVQWSPVLNANYIYASGGGENGKNAFRPWFDYMEGYNGYLFAPVLSNIHIFNVGASIKPCQNTTFSLQGYYYRQADTGSLPPLSNPNIDNGGLGYFANNSSKDLGYELDAILSYDYSKDVGCQIVYAAFIPDNAYTAGNADRVAHEVRGEVNVRF